MGAIIAVVIIIAGAGFMSSRSQKNNYEYVVAQKTDLRQEVSVTGSVKPAQEVDLALERSGRVAATYVKVGDHVTVGQTLVVLDSADVAAQLRQAEAGVRSAQAQLSQYQAALANQQAKLDELKRGARSEDLAVKQAEVAKAEQDLLSDYSAARTTLSDSYAKADEAVRIKTSGIFTKSSGMNYAFTFTTCDSSSGNEALWRRQLAETELNTWYTELQNLNTTLNQITYDQAIDQAQAHLSTISMLFSSLNQTLTVSCALTDSSLDTYRSNVATARTSINTALTNVAAAEQTIAAQKITVQRVRNELLLKQAGASSEELAAQEASVRQAQATVDSQSAIVAQQQAVVQNYQAQLAKNIIRAPFAGLVTKQDAKVGQVTSPNVSLVSLISDKKYQVEANVPEADITKLRLENQATITLDAYGSDVEFNAKVVAIDPAETLVDGVSTYKVTFEFVDDDERVKSGMTANITVLTDTRTQVLAVPQRAVVIKEGKKMVYTLIGDVKQGKLQDVTITTGLVGSDGQVEVLTGLQEGDKVVTSQIK